jgi:hypothetical protein
MFHQGRDSSRECDNFRSALCLVNESRLAKSLPIFECSDGPPVAIETIPVDCAILLYSMREIFEENVDLHEPNGLQV